MKKYISLKEKYLQERKMPEYKAWYSPYSGWFKQFHPSDLHRDIAEDELRLDEISALKKDYYRIYVGKEIDIDSGKIPSDREFNDMKNVIEQNT